MRRCVLAIASIALLSPLLAIAQPYPNYDRNSGYLDGNEGGYQGNYDNRGDYRQWGYNSDYNDERYPPGYARSDVDCQREQQNKQATNAAIGAAAGGLLGNQVAGRGSRTGGTIAGVVLGVLTGYALTHDVDCGDRHYAEPTYRRALEGPIGRRYSWRNDEDRDHGTFTPTREYNQDNYTCRDWRTTTYHDGQRRRRTGSACQYEDGSWSFQ
jgi:surface antigen